MKIGIISDIHGNDEALSLVLADAESVGVEHLLILGDIVGYYYNPDRVMSLLEKWPHHMIAGNHEQMMLKSMSSQSYLEQVTRKYGHGIEIAIQKLTEHQIELLTSLPESLSVDVEGINIGLYHGSPRDADEYIYPDIELDLLKQVCCSGHDYVLMGHTHYPMCTHIEKTSLINPGSVGQPRDIGGLASWAIIDTSNYMTVYRRVKFPVDSLINECMKYDPDKEYLRKVLTRDVKQ